VAELGGLRHSSVQCCNGVSEFLDFFAKVRNGGLQLVDLRIQLLQLSCLFFARLRVCRELGVAPGLVLSFCASFLHKFNDEFLDHPLHLLEGIILNMLGDRE